MAETRVSGVRFTAAGLAHMERLYESVLAGASPVTSFLHASWHSCTISMAYFFDLASPEKAKTF